MAKKKTTKAHPVNDGWPTRDTPGPVSSTDPRSLAYMNDRMKEQGTSLEAVLLALGKPAEQEVEG